MNVDSLLAAESVQLVSFYKPLLMFVVFVPWAWLISSKLEKDARYFHLNHRMWNGIYLGAGVVALAAMLDPPDVLDHLADRDRHPRSAALCV